MKPVKKEHNSAHRSKKHKGGNSSHSHHQKKVDHKVQMGTLFITMRGAGIVRISGEKEPLFVDHDDLGTGMHGDTVEVKSLPRLCGRDRRAEVTKILTRAKVGFAGKLKEDQGTFTLVADDPKMYAQIKIAPNNLNSAKAGDKVFAEIAEWKSMHTFPVGKVVQILGKPGEHEAEMVGLALERGFSAKFPDLVQMEAEELYKMGVVDTTQKRRDMRDTVTFTIDPEDAKDFDDAISVKKLDDGTFEIGVHIADVSHYVRPGTALDAEAYKRGTSVYLVDRTIPMLPEEISNDLCSLKPNVDRLTMSAIFIIDKHAHIKESWFGKTIIHSNKRFTYEAAQVILDQGSGEFFEELTIINDLAKIMAKQRHAEGSVSFESEEVKFVLDKNNVPISAYVKTRGDTHKLIEEWMLVANKKVAEVFKKSEASGGLGMYRIHDLPNMEKLDTVIYLAERLGYNAFEKGKATGKDLNMFLKQIENKPEQGMLSTLLVRSMAKAIYSTKNIGHFGLAFNDYTHFTSPIRRYPDLIVHRLLQNILMHKPIGVKATKEYEKVAIYASERERAASEAERTSIQYKQIEYMGLHVGELFNGIVSGITERGMFVQELTTKSEGFVPLANLAQDMWTWSEKELTLTAAKSGKQFRLGDTVKIKVLGTDPEKREINYEIVG